MPPSDYEVSYSSKILDFILKVNVSIENFAKESSLESNTLLTGDDNFCFDTISGITSHWFYKKSQPCSKFEPCSKAEKNNKSRKNSLEK